MVTLLDPVFHVNVDVPLVVRVADCPIQIAVAVVATLIVGLRKVR